PVREIVERGGLPGLGLAGAVLSQCSTGRGGAADPRSPPRDAPVPAVAAGRSAGPPPGFRGGSGPPAPDTGRGPGSPPGERFLLPVHGPRHCLRAPGIAG